MFFNSTELQNKTPSVQMLECVVQFPASEFRFLTSEIENFSLASLKISRESHRKEVWVFFTHNSFTSSFCRHNAPINLYCQHPPTPHPPGHTPGI